MYTSGTFALFSIRLTQLMLKIKYKGEKKVQPGPSDNNEQCLLINSLFYL